MTIEVFQNGVTWMINVGTKLRSRGRLLVGFPPFRPSGFTVASETRTATTSAALFEMAEKIALNLRSHTARYMNRELHGIVVSAGLMQKTVKVRVGGQKWHPFLQKARHYPIMFTRTRGNGSLTPAVAL